MSIGGAVARVAGCGLAFLLAFGLMSGSLAAWAPFPDVPVAGPKLAYLAKHRDKFDALFIGSSRVQYQVIPAIFDKAAETHSFNLGVAGMVPPESLYIARRVLALRPPRLKWLFIELTDLDSALDPRNASSARAEYWHDARHTWIACRDLWQSARSKRSWNYIAEHTRLFITRASNVGRGAALIAQQFTPPPRKAKLSAIVENGGFIPSAIPSANADQLRRIHSGLDELRSRSWPLVALRPAYREALRDLINDIRGAGIEPVFFNAPRFNWRERLAGPEDARLLSFYDEARHGALLDPANYSDTVHFNAKGAMLFSKALAEEFTASR